MSRKPTRPSRNRPRNPKEASQTASGEEPREAPPEEPTTASEGSEPPNGDGAGTGASKKSLPAFGFAADLLSKDEPADVAATSAEPPTGTGDAETVASATAATADATATASDRIFRFADSLEQASEEQEKVAQRITTWVAFELAGETFALPVEPIREVLRVSGITRVPHAPKPIRGVTNLRGRVIPVIDLRLRIDLPPTPIDRATRIIVVASRKRLLGLLVDAVQQVVHLDLNQVQPPPEDVMTLQSDYISGVYHLADKLVLLLNVDRALIVRDDPRDAEPAQGSGAA